MSKSSSTRSEIRGAKPSPYLRPGRNKVLKRSRRRKMIRRSTAIAVLTTVFMGLLAWGGSIGWGWLSGTRLLELNAVNLSGIHMADEARLRRQLDELSGTNLVAIDLAGLRGSLTADPWVDDVVLKRLFPHTLSVTVLERRPSAVALWNGTPTVVDTSGQPIVGWSSRLGMLDLPLITGLEEIEQDDEKVSRIRTGLRVLVALNDQAPELLERLSEVDVGPDDRIVARFVDQPAPLILHRHDATTNLEHYLAIRDDIHQRLGGLVAVDLRWRGRIVAVPDGNTPRQVHGRRAPGSTTMRGGRRG